MGNNQNPELTSRRASQRRAIGQRLREQRSQRAPNIPLKTFSEQVGLSDSLVSRIESGTASLPLDAVPRIAEVLGCRQEAILSNEPHPEAGTLPFHKAVEFLQKAQLLGIDGLYPDRPSGLSHLVPFAEEMCGGKVFITASSLRGLEQRPEHRFVRRLMAFGHSPTFEVSVIMTHPRLGSEREHQERRPPGSIVREILTGITWCIESLRIPPSHIRLTTASPSSFSIFLIDGPEGRAIINPYPTMRQAFLSFTLAVRSVPVDGRAGEVISVYQTYLEANFREPWQDQQVTVGLIKGLQECQDLIDNRDEECEELRIHGEMLKRVLAKCRERETAAR